MNDFPTRISTVVNLCFTAMRRYFCPIGTVHCRKIPIEYSNRRITIHLYVDIFDIEMPFAEMVVHCLAIEMIANRIPAIFIAARMNKGRTIIGLPNFSCFFEIIVSNRISIFMNNILNRGYVLCRGTLGIVFAANSTSALMVR